MNNGPDVGGALSKDTSYHFEIGVAQDRWSITLNGELIYFALKTAHELYDSIPCYASDPWYGAANVELSNMVVTSGSVYVVSSEIVLCPL